LLYEQWELTGKSPPVLMVERAVFELQAGGIADADCDGVVNLRDDYVGLSGCITGPAVGLVLGCEPFDSDLDGDVDLDDAAEFQLLFLPIP
jgi:hypothetical protein